MLVTRPDWDPKPVIVAPATVQGDGAAAEIAAALDRLARSGRVNVVIVGRGGGLFLAGWGGRLRGDRRGKRIIGRSRGLFLAGRPAVDEFRAIRKTLIERGGIKGDVENRLLANDKLVIVPDGQAYNDDQIRALTAFQEQFFRSEIWRSL